MHEVRGDAWSGMEIRQVLARVLLGHWRVLAALAVLGLVGGLALHVRDHGLYSASARVELGAGDPSAVAGSQGVADTARAIVTSPSHVAAAIAATRVSRDPATVAERAVTVQQMGASDVVEVAVTDQDAAVAAQLANALADDLVRTRQAVGQGGAGPALDEQISQVQTQLQDVGARIAEVNGQLVAAAAADVPALSARLTSLDSERGDLVQRQLSLESQRQQQRLPALIDPAARPARPTASRRPLDMALGAVLGLLAGVVVAGVVETFRPTVIGSRWVADAVDAPLLGELPRRPNGAAIPATGLLAARLRMRMGAAGVPSVVLAGPGDPAELAPFAAGLAAEIGDPVRVAGAAPNGCGHQAPAAGVVLVVPSSLTRAELADATELPTLTYGPVVGVVTYRRGGHRGVR
jgi:uncharacterized protein involved in exopolysaccharide biosynthesis